MNRKKHSSLLLHLLSAAMTATLCQGAGANSAEYPALIGHGFDALRLQHMQQSCVEGNKLTSTQIEDTTEFKRVENWSDFLTQMNFSIPGSIYLNSGSEIAKFAARARDSFLSSTYVMTTETSVSREVMTNPTVTYEPHENDKFSEVCGNQYVSVVEYGGLFHVGLKFAFSDVQYKEEFDAGGALQSLTGLKTKIDGLGQDVRKHSPLEVFVHQLGGEVDELHAIFDSSDIMSCSLDNFEPCENLIKEIFSYSTRFVKAVQSGKHQPIGYKTSSYPNREKPMESSHTRKERGRLLDELEQHLADFDSIYVMKANPGDFRIGDNEKCDNRCLQKIANEISSNIRSLKEAVVLSFQNPEEFLEEGVLSSLDLRKYGMPYKENGIHKFMRKNMRFVFGTLVLGVVIPVVYRYGSPLLGRLWGRGQQGSGGFTSRPRHVLSQSH